jgi:P-type Cu2+ transporter
MSGSLACAHCALPLGVLAQRREVAGEPCSFCCYGCCLAYQVHHGVADEHDAAKALIRLGVGVFLAMNVMLFSLLLYAGAFSGVDAWLRMPVTVLLWILATPLVVMLGGPFFLAAARALRQRRVTTDTLVSIGVLAAYGYSALQVLRGSELVYFDAASLVLVLFTLGRYLEAQGRAQAARSLAPMLAAERAEVSVIADENHWQDTVSGDRRALRSILPGMLVRVLPGERIAVDGLVVAGRSHNDESILSGQSRPRAKAAGDVVFAGSVNGTGPLLIRATSAGTETRWIQISRLVREALARKSMTAETVDRVVAVFVPCVLLLALASAWYWNVTAGTEAALLSVLAVLVVACPCALGLAAPLANALAIGAAARRGVLIRGGAVLERLAKLRAIAFDKTGTLTRGERQLRTLAAHGASEAEVVRHARALAATSTHPVARAILATSAGGPGAECVESVEEHAGKGVSGRLDGMPAELGSAAWMNECGRDIPQRLRQVGAEAGTSVFVAWAGVVHGCFTFDDAPLGDAGATIRELHERGLLTLLLSGDAQSAVARVATTLGIREAFAQMLPEDKAHALQAWRGKHGYVAMVGDGLNDGPVLAAATVGIAVGNATDLAKESADVVLPPGALASLPWLIDLARHAQRSVHMNLAWAFGYNLIALSLAASGLLQPVIAAALMAGSSILVVVRSWRAAGRDQRRGTARPSESIVAAPGVERWV